MNKIKNKHFIKYKAIEILIFGILFFTANESAHACGKNVKVIIVDLKSSNHASPLSEIHLNPNFSGKMNDKIFIETEPSASVDRFDQNQDQEINILVVDDLSIYHKMIKNKFRNHPNVRVFSADNGTEAINMVRFFNSKKIVIHTLFMDYDMRDTLTGVETLLQLYDEKLLGQHTQVIAHSSEPKFNEMLLNAGAEVAINKGDYDVNYKKIVMNHQIKHDSEKMPLIEGTVRYDERGFRSR